MSTAKRKVAACFMAVVMTFSMVSATAMTAFAETLTAGSLDAQASGDIVYDSVYGTLHGEYALMMKSVTYEQEYNGRMETYTATLTDLVKADGTPHGKVMLHTSNAYSPAALKALPEGASDYEIHSLGGNGRDVNAGYVKVLDKSTHRAGLKNLDGTELIPCNYNSLSLASKDTILGLVVNGSQVKADFFDGSGAACGSTSFEIAGLGNSSWYAFPSFYGSFIQLSVNVRTENGYDRHDFFVRKDGSKWVKAPDMVKILSGDNESSDGAIVYAKSDGSVWYCNSSGAETRLTGAEGARSADVFYGIVQVAKDAVSGSNTANTFYNTAGTKLNLPSGSIAAAARDAFIFREYGGDNGFNLYDTSGKKLCAVDCVRADTLEGAHFLAIVDKGSGDDAYSLQVLNQDGMIFKELGQVSSSYAHLTPLYGNVAQSNMAVIGYSLDDYYSADEKSHYFDLEFNELASDPREGMFASMTLADGTAVNATIYNEYDPEQGKFVVDSWVIDENGKPIVLNGYTLGIAKNEGNPFNVWNHVNHGIADMWWATDAKGKWGAVDSSGAVLVPFQYESYFDAGMVDTDYALVKENGVWKFLKVTGGPDVPQKLGMHRLYNPYSGEHFYTSNEAEYKNVKAAGWNDEGTGWTAPSFSNTPVYRLYNKYGGEHHYCMDKGERDMLVKAGWNDEDIGWYSDDAKTVPLYREYNPYAFANNHNYTTSQDEHKHLVSIGWKDEGYAWYGI